MNNRHELLRGLILLPLLLFFSTGVCAQVARDPQRDLSVSFSSRHKGDSPGFVFGELTNKSINAYPCVLIEFDLYTRFDQRPLGEESRHLGVLPVEVQNVTPRSVRKYSQQLPYAAGIGLKSISECQEQPGPAPSPAPPDAPEVLPQILSFAVRPARIQAGQTATLQWRTANADRIIVGLNNPNWPRVGSGPMILEPRSIEPSGSLPVRPLQTTTFRLEATKGADSVSRVVIVEVASSGYGDGPNKHWQLRSESKVPNEPVSGSGARYRFITAGGQLATNTKVFEGLRLIPLSEGGENLQIHQGAARSNISLNQPFALFSYTRGAYIIYKKGLAFSLGFVDWDPTREPPMPRPAGVVQWELRSPPGASVRDHRTRNIVTLETLGLFNTSMRAYLVYDSTTRTLSWLKP